MLNGEVLLWAYLYMFFNRTVKLAVSAPLEATLNQILDM